VTHDSLHFCGKNATFLEYPREGSNL
jgi:hypothetical protein